MEERQKRYKVLMSLLGKSKEYANYMSEKLTCSKESTAVEAAEAAPEVLQNSTNRAKRKRKSAARDDDVSPPKKTKVELEEPTYNPETHYKNAMGLVVSRRQPSLLTGGTMRDYQLDGLEWMVALYKNGVNGILADEMGLGKTIQVISLLCHLREKRVYGPHLIIGPLSTLPNWIFEFANFAPEIPVALYHGVEEKRHAVMKRFVEAMPKNKRTELPVMITSYEMPLRDRKFLSAVKWGSIIVDEGHRLKNYQSMLSQALKAYKTDYRLLLTGTPLQNNITELWSLLNYLIPEIFDDLSMFENLFDFSDLRCSEKQNEFIQREKEEQLISKMHQILEPFLLRRVKADVAIALPAKKEILVKSPLTSEQEELYKIVLDKTIASIEMEPEAELIGPDGKRKKRSCALNKTYSEDWDISEDTEDLLPNFVALPTSKNKKRMRSAKQDIEYVFNIKLTSPFMMLRKIVNHPYLVKTPVVPGTRDIIIDENLIQQSGKLLVLDALLPKLKANGHKILLFSTFRIMLDLVEDYVIMRKYKYCRLDGMTSIESRLERIKAFNTDPDTFIFLISTRAGGLGINLTAADTVIIYDSDWNPQVDLQAQDRCHRIGQTRPVVVYRLITAGTIDEHIMNIAVYKRRLEKLIVKKGKFKKKATEDELSLAELKEVLESTDYKQVIHPNGLVLSDEEIERLLDRSDLLEETALAATATTVQPSTTVATSSKTEDKKAKAKATPRRRGNQR
jgi:ATP-dependent DNA helicase